MREFDDRDASESSDLLGRGSFSRVTRVEVDGRPFALKTVVLEGLSPGDLRNLESEISIHRELRHPRVIRFYSERREEGSVRMLLELAENGSLLYYINGLRGVPEEAALRIFKQCCEGLAFIHARGVLHGDIKPENVLLDSEFDAKLCDFGWATRLVSSQTATHPRGTFEYMAPEVAFHKPHGLPADVWSLGVFLFELLHGSAPFRARNLPQIRTELSGPLPNFRADISPATKDLLARLLRPDFRERPSVEQILAHQALSPSSPFAPAFQGKFPPELLRQLANNFLLNADHGRIRPVPPHISALAKFTRAFAKKKEPSSERRITSTEFQTSFGSFKPQELLASMGSFNPQSSSTTHESPKPLGSFTSSKSFTPSKPSTPYKSSTTIEHSTSSFSHKSHGSIGSSGSNRSQGSSTPFEASTFSESAGSSGSSTPPEQSSPPASPTQLKEFCFGRSFGVRTTGEVPDIPATAFKKHARAGPPATFQADPQPFSKASQSVRKIIVDGPGRSAFSPEGKSVSAEPSRELSPSVFLASPSAETLKGASLRRCFSEWSVSIDSELVSERLSAFSRLTMTDREIFLGCEASTLGQAPPSCVSSRSVEFSLTSRCPRLDLVTSLSPQDVELSQALYSFPLLLPERDLALKQACRSMDRNEDPPLGFLSASSSQRSCGADLRTKLSYSCSTGFLGAPHSKMPFHIDSGLKDGLRRMRFRRRTELI